MIKSIGSDLVEVNRIKDIGIDRFKDRVLSEEELKEYLLITHDKRKLSYLAGRFAAKEALFKCFKKGNKTANYKDFSVLNDKDGAPYIVSKYTEQYVTHITITHEEHYAIAFVILETLE
ncbi:Holo-[acyl-carrier-protein] synthase [Acholeplasma oculi]|uniref:Holo-[acyl-carrier-protein] synthase n=1 Tax=Acholeplasma oculi TaxID=35623 RepID=A0A061AF24_9MOLU|nr:holo-ACP synthase [Acholeplasma oculi]CDR30126.1 Holo-[acyl-carrier protein] synthase [Acholeplasma oculi]SKC44634.1 holo-[acyl-carrier protein] synthase [Acholeplasma oculi]SUT88426.1 Holo-[acyl-carrier-protein] synthase [Acholeplasma oculi]